MSGFVGLASRAPMDPATLQRLTAAVAYRGTEPVEVWSSGFVGFGYAHLATNQAGESSEQPTTVAGRTRIVGHILLCARAELIAELATAGIVLPANSTDAVLVLHAYRAWRDQCATHITGEFAFAIWDEDRHTLLCVRDHFGVRPFYYAEVPDGIVFSNTLSAILQHPNVSRAVNEVAVADLLIAGVNLEPDTTGFAQVRRLPAGHFLEWRDGELRAQRYYSVPLDGHIRYRKDADYVDHFLKLFDQAISERMPRSGPVAIRFSGGMDSSSIAATIRAVAPHIQLKGFTLHYERVMMADREHEYARAAADYIGMPLELINCDDVPLFGAADGWDPELKDVAFMDGNVDLYRRMGDHARVALSGDTGDHVFLPPYSYFRDRLRAGELGQFLTGSVSYVQRFRSPPPIGLRTALNRLRYGAPVTKPEPWVARDFALRHRMAGRWERALSAAVPHPMREYAHRIITSPIQAWQFERDDARAAVNRTETRHVFADVRLVEYLLAIPGTPWMFHKLILREAMRGRLPETIRTRRKTPMPEYCVAACLRDRGGDFSLVARTPGIERFIDVNAHPAQAAPGQSYGFYTPMLNTSGLSLARWLQLNEGSLHE